MSKPRGGGDYSTSRYPADRDPYYSRERFRDKQNSLTDRVRPSGLIKKYPNYEPFHPPPQENFVYPEHMHPPTREKTKQQRRRRSSSRDRRSKSRSLSKEEDRSYRQSYHHNEFHGHRNSRRDREYNYSQSRSRSRGSEEEERNYRWGGGEGRRKKRSYSREAGGGRVGSSKSSSPSYDDKVNGKTLDPKSMESALRTYWAKTESGDESEVDLGNELHPLADHIHDRKRLFKEAVRSLKGKRLKAMIPPQLKDMPIEELEERCLDILDEVDVEKMLNILNGKLAGVFDDPVEPKQKEGGDLISLYIKNGTSKKGKKKLKTKGKKKVGGTGVGDDKDGEGNKTEGKKGKSKGKSKKKSKESLDKKKGKKKKEKNKVSPMEKMSEAPKSLMELLELEFRAKAIKALMRAQGILEPPPETPEDPLLPSDKEQKEEQEVEVLEAEKDIEVQEAEQYVEVQNEIQKEVEQDAEVQEEIEDVEVKDAELEDEEEAEFEDNQDVVVLEEEGDSEFEEAEVQEDVQVFEEDQEIQEEENIEEPEEDEEGEIHDDDDVEEDDLEVQEEQDQEQDHYVEEEKCEELVQVQDEDEDVLILQAHSPVEFITNFEDTEPISEDETNEEEAQALSTLSIKAVTVSSQFSSFVPVQGCEDRSNEIEISNKDEKASGDESERKNHSKPNKVDREEEEEDKPITWYERWFQSSSMQKVVKTNKIQKKLKSKLKSSKPQDKKTKEAPIMDVNVTSEPIIGSIEEYEKLFGKKVAVASSSKDQEKMNDGPNEDNESVEEDEDDGTEDLWGNIMD